jgi:LmbE family N-acetylglucosaminyl deacetylase
MSKILIVAAHPDDEILGVGGTVIWHVEKGDEVSALILGEGITARYEKRQEAPQADLKSLKAMSKRAGAVLGYSDIRYLDMPDNRLDSLDFLDIVKAIEKIIIEISPETVYTHFEGDLNIDHTIAARAVITACRPIAKHPVRNILAFDTASATGWGFNSNVFTPTVFCNIEDQIGKKIEAMRQYDTEVFEYPHPRSLEALQNRASFWGSQSGLKYAEPFQLIRKIRT